MKEEYGGARTGDFVVLLEPLRVRVRMVSPDVVGTCLAKDLSEELELPVGTTARLELGKGRWGEDAMWLHFDLPGYQPFTKGWAMEMERWPRVRKVGRPGAG